MSALTRHWRTGALATGPPKVVTKSLFPKEDSSGSLEPSETQVTALVTVQLLRRPDLQDDLAACDLAESHAVMRVGVEAVLLAEAVDELVVNDGFIGLCWRQVDNSEVL